MNKRQRYNASAYGKYANQLRAARRRNIPFLLTFAEWLKLWQDSGKWEQRGRHKGQYCLARYEDKGPYTSDNVRVCLNKENHVEAHRTSPNNGERNGMYGKSPWHHYTPEQRAARIKAVSEKQKGRPKSAATRAAMATAARRRWSTHGSRQTNPTL